MCVRTRSIAASSTIVLDAGCNLAGVWQPPSAARPACGKQHSVRLQSDGMRDMLLLCCCVFLLAFRADTKPAARLFYCIMYVPICDNWSSAACSFAYQVEPLQVLGTSFDKAKLMRYPGESTIAILYAVYSATSPQARRAPDGDAATGGASSDEQCCEHTFAATVSESFVDRACAELGTLRAASCTANAS